VLKYKTGLIYDILTNSYHFSINDSEASDNVPLIKQEAILDAVLEIDIHGFLVGIKLLDVLIKPQLNFLEGKHPYES